MKKQYVIIILSLIILGGGIYTLSLYKYIDENMPRDVLTERMPCDQSATTTLCKVLQGTREEVAPIPSGLSGKIDEYLTIDNTLRDVNFCGKMYKTKQIKIDDADVVQRVAELATKNLIPEMMRIGPYGPKMNEWKTLTTKKGETANEICENVYLNTPNVPNPDPSTISENGVIQIGEVGTFPSTNLGQKGKKMYAISAPGFSIIVNPATNEIFNSNDYDGSLIGPIGTLK